MLTRRNAAFAAFVLAGFIMPMRLAQAQEPSAAPLPIADAPTGAATNSAPLQMPVRGGAITLKVTDFLGARQKVLDAATTARAEITDGKTYVAGNGRKHGYIRLRLAASQLPELLRSVRSVGTLYSDNLFASDQRSDYEELGRRIEQLKKHQKRLEAMLSTTRRLRGSDMLYVQERLFRAEVDQSALEQQRLDQERASQTATITVTLFEPLSSFVTPVAHRTPTVERVDLGHWFLNAKKRATLHWNRLLTKLVAATAYVFVYAPLWLPLLVGALLILRTLWIRRARIGESFFSVVGRMRQAVHTATLLSSPSAAKTFSEGTPPAA